MKIPSIINAKDTSNPLNGIIKKIKDYSSDPISDKIIVPYAVPSYWGNCKNPIMWDGDFATNDQDRAYLIVQFPNRFLHPTHYTIRGVQTAGYHYQKEWEVYGYNKGEEDYPSKWWIISKNVSTKDTFCGADECCVTTRRVSLFPMTVASKGFEYIRFKATLGYTSTNRFTTSAIEFFGTLSTKKYLHMQCTNLNQRNLVNFMNVYIVLIIR